MSTLQLKWGDYAHVLWKNISQKTMLRLTAMMCISALLAWGLYLFFQNNC